MGIFIDNPQILVERASQAFCPTETLASLEAIFVPFRGRHKNVQELISELSWYTGCICLMPSQLNDFEFIRQYPHGEVVTLPVKDKEFVQFYSRLRTSNHRYSAPAEYWDLPIKRNFALLYAREKAYRRILLVDDDIRKLTPPTVHLGSDLLDKYIIAGCFVQDYLDTSILGYLQRIAGEEVLAFLSGSFLFLKPFECTGFFPSIYNEDWLFMLPHVLNHSICSFGTIEQLHTDAFADSREASFQEFGEVIAEGLYALIQSGVYGRRYDAQIWTEFIVERRKIFNSLKTIRACLPYREFIDSAVSVNELITCDDCVSFVYDLEEDARRWQLFLKERGL